MQVKTIYHGCLVRIEKSIPRGRCLPSLTKQWPSDEFFYLHLTPMKDSYILHMDRVKQIWYLSPMRAAKVQASLHIRAVSPEPLLLAHTSSESRGTFRQKARSLAPLNGWTCAVKICHDGMPEDTNSLDGAHLYSCHGSVDRGPDALLITISWSLISHHCSNAVSSRSGMTFGPPTDKRDLTTFCNKLTNTHLKSVKNHNFFTVIQRGFIYVWCIVAYLIY